MKSFTVAAGIVGWMLVTAAVPSAQLGEVARKEAERRKTAKTGKEYTNDTLKPDPQSTASAPAPTDSAATPAPTPADGAAASPAPAPRVSADPAERKNQETQWREKVKAAREALDRAKTFAEALTSRVNALTTDFVNRDDPAQRSKIAADRDKAAAELSRVLKEVEQHTKAIATIQEEARKAGVPAGWVR